ncbi:hypothetical protein CYMTET_34764 [Cymbomonas tetramitiformis]|uniref:N-acetylgalactosaminide beta-1,3-galactosyltransferase n=1 Tax=Cymbomonas tetramitiformis TaxID=36881 RepID=A0AAE0FB12_9CHLO|nr:hypothetical protein CYMTET_34764 [Cymbomonas tetramitiformis]
MGSLAGVPNPLQVWRMWHKVATTDELYRDFDWFGKIDTDAWLSVPNLRRFVQFYDPEEAHYMGHTVLHRWGNMNSPFNLGCGYIISRGALRRVRPALEAIPNTPACSSENACPALCVDRPGAREDPTMGICLHGVGVVPDNTLDEHYRQRFLPFQYNDHYNSMKYTPNLAADWYWTLKPKGIGDMHHCCSPEPILFHNYKAKLYKTGNAGLRDEFEAFEAKWTVLDNRPADVPPRPQCFLYNPEHVTFPFDEHRNVKKPPTNQRIYTEEGTSPCRAPDFTEYSSLSIPGV